MIDLSKIIKNCIFICPNEKKDELVSLFNSNIEYSVKYISKGTLISSLTFSYGNDAIFYLMNKGYSYDNSKEILDNLNFVKNGTDKLDLLMSLKEELIKNDLLKTNPLFIHIFKNKKVYVCGYSSMDKQLRNLLEIKHCLRKEEKNALRVMGFLSVGGFLVFFILILSRII